MIRSICQAQSDNHPVFYGGLAQGDPADHSLKPEHKVDVLLNHDRDRITERVVGRVTQAHVVAVVISQSIHHHAPAHAGTQQGRVPPPSYPAMHLAGEQRAYTALPHTPGRASPTGARA